MLFPINLLPPFSGQLLKFKCNLLGIKCINLKCRVSVTPAPSQPLWASSSGLDLAPAKGNPPPDFYHHRLGLPVFELHKVESYSMYSSVSGYFGSTSFPGQAPTLLCSAALYSLSLL